ncbi:TetR/AcrR family transcriptional regulator [Dictyobacter formicarum]|uniref:TetR family transcriptional regulator n=1 Tax=Dictyobacter formicarum TaxID=2778368 RepID=A0ABQ3VDZ6_9CHLR|nr:TetR/AcrR family transcriptional regulator [Dictyobacter formicarum]GHO84015.1 TetR family transcriptional regulator [Dictyobacter formicarum]
MRQEKQDRRSQRTRQLVTKALAELLQEKRYEDITVRDIVERANVGSSTFYAHYFDKEDVQAALLKQLFEQLHQQLLRRGGRQEIVPSMELIQHVQQNAQQLQALVRSRSGETLWKVVERSISQIIEQSIMEQTSSKWSYAVPVPIVAHYLAATLLTLLKWWLSTDMPYSPEQMNDFFQQLALPDRWVPVKSKDEEIGKRTSR